VTARRLKGSSTLCLRDRLENGAPINVECRADPSGTPRLQLSLTRLLPMRNLLLIDHMAFVDGWLYQTERMFELALGLRIHDWNCCVLSAKPSRPVLDPSAEQAFPGRVIRTPFGSSPYPRYVDRKGLRTLWRLACGSVGRSNSVLAPAAGWATRLRRWRSLQEGCVGKVDALWAICPGNLLNVAATYELAKRLSCPWVIEFHDPCPYPNEQLTKLEEQTLHSSLESCAAVVTTTQAYAGHLCNRYSCCRGKTLAVCLSFDDAWVSRQMPGRSRSGELSLLHAGALPGGKMRNAISLTKALAKAAALEPATRGKIQLRLFGNTPGIQEAADLAKSLGNPGSVVAHPMISSRAVHEEMARSDVLVVIKQPDPAYGMQIPGKLFQYLPFGKPILGIMERTSEAAGVLRQSGLGITSGYEEADLTARQLLELWRGREALAEDYRPNWDYIMQFSRSHMALKVSGLLRGLVNRDMPKQGS